MPEAAPPAPPEIEPERPPAPAVAFQIRPGGEKKVTLKLAPLPPKAPKSEFPLPPPPPDIVTVTLHGHSDL